MISMKNIRIGIVLFLLYPYFLIGQTASPNHLDGVVYMKIDNQASITLIPYDNSDTDFNQIIADFEIVDILNPFSGIGSDTLDLTYKFHFEDTMNVDQLITELNVLPWVDYSEKAPLFEVNYTPDDSDAQQWYLSKIDAFSGWGFTQGSTDVSIAIIDNAVRVMHDDMTDNLWVNTDEQENGLDSDLNGYTDDIYGYDVADGDNDPNPPSTFTSGAFSHGTHCAGSASASTDNGLGVAGVGFNCKIMSVKCTRDSDDGAILTHAYEGLRYAIDANADIISMSWGSRASSFTGDALINTAVLNGITMFAAAGNDDEDNLLSPASHADVMAVGATDENDERAAFSNYGDDIAFMAPGKSIYNLLGGNNSDYGYSSGTSMSCPIAAGFGGLILSHYPNFTPDDIKNAIVDGCVFIDDINPGYEDKLGAGRINIGNTFNILSTEDYGMSEGIKYFPNPTSKMLIIRSKNRHIEKQKIEVFDNIGRKVTNKVKVYSENERELIIDNLSNLENGVYSVRFEGSKTIRFIVE